jgi:hypothetical protein
MTIIQLISGETLQNVLPVLALRPKRIVSVLSTHSPFFSQRTNYIENAVTMSFKASRADVPAFEDTRMGAIGLEAPTIDATRAKVMELIAQFPDAVINYTGGTKEMSIGAWRAAEATGRPSLYCDSPREFRSGGTGEIEFPVQLPELARSIAIETILAAQGLAKDRDWQLQPISRKRFQFGKIASQLQQASPSEIRELRKTIRRHGLGKPQSKHPSWDDINRVAAKPLPVPAALGQAEETFLEAAIAAGLIVKRGAGWYLSFGNDGSLEERGSSLRAVVTQLDGGAFESHVNACLQRSSRFHSFLHGVKPLGPTEIAEFGETDFLAVDSRNFSLTLISCKSTAPKLEHLESVLARKQKFGGRFARAMLCVEWDQPKRLEQLRRQCGNLEIECVIGTELEEALRCVGGEGVGG